MRNHLYKFDKGICIDQIINRLTKVELKGLLDDYDTKLDRNVFNGGGKHNRSLLDYKVLCHKLNAALCIQHYAIVRYGCHKYVNNVCPITLCSMTNPIEIIFKGAPPKGVSNQSKGDHQHPFQFYVSRYELDDFARYLMASMSFIDINTQRQLTKLHVRKIDAIIHRNHLFFPSLFNLYITRLDQTIHNVNPPHLEMQSLLLGIERSVTVEVEMLHDFLFEPPTGQDEDLTMLTTQNDSVKRACAAVTRMLNHIKKINVNHMQIVKSDIIEHLNDAARHSVLQQQPMESNTTTNFLKDDHLQGRVYIFEALNAV